MRPRLLGLAALAVIALASPAAAEQGMYSYVPADAETRRLTDQGLTFVFEKQMMGGRRIEKVMSTEAPAAAVLKPANLRELGAPLDQVIGRDANEREVYAVTEAEQGPAMVRAFCPGSTRGWLAFGPMRARRDLRVLALGDDPATGKARLCATLDFKFRGEWKLPPLGRPPSLDDVSRP